MRPLDAEAVRRPGRRRTTRRGLGASGAFAFCVVTNSTVDEPRLYSIVDSSYSQTPARKPGIAVASAMPAMAKTRFRSRPAHHDKRGVPAAGDLDDERVAPRSRRRAEPQDADPRGPDAAAQPPRVAPRIGRTEKPARGRARITSAAMST